MTVAYRRILLKLSGEALMGDDDYGISRDMLARIVAEIAEIRALGVEVGVVIGGGNIFRGVAGGAAGMANPNLSEKKTHAKVGLGVVVMTSRGSSPRRIPILNMARVSSA